jgi:hypothetical protein
LGVQDTREHPLSNILLSWHIKCLYGSINPNPAFTKCAHSNMVWFLGAGLLCGKDVMGLTRDQCMISLGNIDSRTQLLLAFPYLLAFLCDRAWSTDDIETWFGQLVLKVGYKPAWNIAARVLQYLQEVTRIQRDPKSKIHLASARKCSYPHYQAIVDHMAKWHAPVGEDNLGTMFLAYLADVTRRASRDTSSNAGIRKLFKDNATHTSNGVV